MKPVSASSPAPPAKWASRSSISSTAITRIPRIRSARVSRVGFGVSPKRTFVRNSRAIPRLLVSCAQILPALQCNRDVAILPDEIVEGAEIEFLALLHARFGEEFRNLEFADLIRDGLAGTG